MYSQVDLQQHPLTINIINNDHQQEDHVKQSPNSRRRGRGSRRRTSTTIYDIYEPVVDPFFITPHHQQQPHRHKSSTTIRSQKNSRSKEEKDNDSPAFQSLVDIIREMKRLPSISITTTNKQQQATITSLDAAWHRMRRHSEPPRKVDAMMIKKHDPKDIHGKPIFSNSFLALQEEDVGENNNSCETLVSPLKLLTPLPPTKRTRSQSVPNNILPLTRPEQPTTRRPLYPVHLTVPEASAAIRTRTLFSGIIRVDIQDSSEAFVECEELDCTSIYIFGSRHRNRALDGDEVAIELVDVDDMLYEKQSKRQARHTRRLSFSHSTLSSIPEIDHHDGDIHRPKPKYCGKVVCILERPRNMLFSGTLSLYRPHAKTLDNASRDKKDTSPKIIWFVPADKRLPLVAVPIKHAPVDFIKYHEEYKNRIFIGHIQRWPATSLHPFGFIEKEIGWMGELSIHSGALMADHHIKDMEFSEGVLKAAATTVPPFSSLLLTEQDRKGRRDLTKEAMTIFTMGESDKDLDNAFSITNTKKGIFEIGIHVTDVSNYVCLGTPLDREARERSCSVELVDKKIAILPVSFTESHCSLGVADKERLAYSVLCRFTENGVLLHAWIGKTIVKSKGHVYLPPSSPDDDLKQDRPLKSDATSILKICQKLQHNRLNKLHSTSLAKSFQVFKLAKSGYPEEIDRFNQTDKDVLLQELLIVANIEVGQKISSRFPDQALLYRQDVPKLSKLSIIQDYFDNNPLTKSINNLLRLAKENESSIEKQEALVHVIHQCIPRSKYFSAGSLDISKYRHVGYGASILTVFTEPLHNYVSIFVQRQLSAALRGEEQQNDNFDITDKIARHCNSSHLSKLAAEQDSKKLYTAAYMYRQCLNELKKVIIVEAFAINFDTDLVHLYIPEYDMEIPVVLNEKSVPGGGYHVYNVALNEMDIIWEQDTTLKLKFLSSVYISIHVDMKVIRPVFEIEFLK